MPARLSERLGGRPAQQAPTTPAASRLAQAGDPALFGFSVREHLYPGEDSFFKQNPTTGGMASESGHIILNPYSPETVDRQAVARNEALRLLFKREGVAPDFQITDQQRGAFQGTPYANDEQALRATIAARIYSGDPSALATDEQKAWLQQYLMGRQ